MARENIIFYKNDVVPVLGNHSFREPSNFISLSADALQKILEDSGLSRVQVTVTNIGLSKLSDGTIILR